MRRYCEHDTEGRITASGQMNSTQLVALVASGAPVIPGDIDGQSCRIDMETMAPVDLLPAPWALDTSSIAADGVDAATLSGLPIPCVVSIDGVEHLIDDGDIVFTASTPGAYVFRIDHVLYLPMKHEVVAE